MMATILSYILWLSLESRFRTGILQWDISDQQFPAMFCHTTDLL
jgi:hypothetical protein